MEWMYCPVCSARVYCGSLKRRDRWRAAPEGIDAPVFFSRLLKSAAFPLVEGSRCRYGSTDAVQRKVISAKLQVSLGFFVPRFTAALQ